MIEEKKVFIVLPAYNAEKTLEKTVKEIPKEYRKNILLVDDCSKDNTANLARSLGIPTIVHQKNTGYGGNQKTCYTEALKQGADIVVMLHPDHQYNASVIPELVNPIKEGLADAVFGSRMLGGKPLEGGMPRWKYIANVFLTATANIAFMKYFTEIHSGFRAYSRKYLESVDFLKNSDDFIFDTEIIARGIAKKLEFLEVPIVTRYFDEVSSISFIKGIKYGLLIFWVLIKYRLGKYY